MKKLLSAFIVLAVLGGAAPFAAFASEDEGGLDPVHHTADGYYLDFQPLGKVELPRIFLVRGDDGSFRFDVYSSTAAALRSGKYVPELEELDAEGETHLMPEALHTAEAVDAMIGSGAHLDAHLVPAQGHLVIDFSITRHLVFALFAGLLITALFVTLAQRYKRGIGRTSAPRGIVQNLAETLIVFVRDEIAKPNLGDRYGKFLPYLLTIFFFILVCNLLGLVPFGATATSNLMVTAVLATFTFLLTQINGSKDHWKHVFWPPGVPALVKPILIPVEIMGLFTKPIALAIRLFANMTAGHLVILSLIGLIFTFSSLFGTAAAYGVSPVSVAFALFVSLLEVLIAFIQAYIFTILSALFIGMAVAEHGHEEHEEAHASHPVGAEGALPETAEPAVIEDGAAQRREAAPVPAPTLAPAG